MSLTDQDLNRIQAVVNVAVEPLKKEVNMLNERVDKLPTLETVKSIVQAETEPLQKYIAKLPTHNEFEEFKTEINEKISNLPTKDEFFTAMDQYAGEQQTIRQEQLTQQLQIDRINSRTKHL